MSSLISFDDLCSFQHTSLNFLWKVSSCGKQGKAGTQCVCHMTSHPLSAWPRKTDLSITLPGPCAVRIAAATETQRGGDSSFLSVCIHAIPLWRKKVWTQTCSNLEATWTAVPLYGGCGLRILRGYACSIGAYGNSRWMRPSLVGWQDTKSAMQEKKLKK